MAKTFIILVAASICQGLQLDGLRVKFGWTDAMANIEYFFNIPRTIVEAEAMGLKRTERPSSPMPELRMYCPTGRNVCPIYDVGGFVAGLQIAIPKSDFESLAIEPQKKFQQWRPNLRTMTDMEPSKDYWALTQYFVSAESLKAGAGPQVENGATLQDGGVWVTGPDGTLLRIPSTEAELNTTAFKRQNCVPNMGTHYYYNMTPEMKCEDYLPWFVLTKDGEVLGTGFQVFGKLTKAQPRDWFETVPLPKQSALITVPYGPKCLYEWAEAAGILSMHIYYVDKPWKIRCKAGDSIKPPPVFERVLLNGHRYVSQISDEFRKLFSG